jgi:hypothetical protein
MENPETFKVDECDTVDANRGLISESSKPRSAWFGIALLVIGGGMTLLWIGFILWLLGNFIGYL